MGTGVKKFSSPETVVSSCEADQRKQKSDTSVYHVHGLWPCGLSRH